MDNTNTPTSTSQLALQAASSQAQPTLDAAAEKAAAEKAAAEKAAAERAAAEKAAAEKAAAKPARPRRGPPADGGDEERVDAILSTSKLLGAGGDRLRRGMAVSVPKRRAIALERSGKIRFGTAEEVERAATRLGSARIG